MVKRTYATKEKVVHFENPLLQLEADFSQNNDNSINKRALVLIEGSHTDSKKRNHIFTKERIKNIVNNTNALFDSGGTIPILIEHRKSQEARIGDLTGTLEAKIITEEDLPNPRSKHLIGKLGAFASSVTIKAKDAIEQAKAGLLNTISPGIDISTDCIREISAVVQPAILGLSLFKKNNSLLSSSSTSKFGLTLEEAELESQDLDAAREEFNSLCDLFWSVIENINSCGEEELAEQNPNDLQYQALDDFYIRVESLLNLQEQKEKNEQINGSYQNQMTAKSGQILAAFSLAEMEKLKKNSNAEFAYPWERRKKKPTIGQRIRRGAASVGKLAAGGALLAGGIRYGGAGFRGATRGIRKALPGPGLSSMAKPGLRSRLGSGAYAARTRLGNDLRGVGKFIGSKGVNLAQRGNLRAGAAVMRTGLGTYNIGRKVRGY